MAVIQGRYPKIVAKAARIWDQSAGKTPAGTTVERTDAEALRSGSISVKVVNRAGDAIAGVPFTVTLQGAARFVQGGNTFSGVVDERRVLDRVGGDRRRRGDGEHHIRVWADARHGQHSGHAGL